MSIRLACSQVESTRFWPVTNRPESAISGYGFYDVCTSE
jgi:hypothetical protein